MPRASHVSRLRQQFFPPSPGEEKSQALVRASLRSWCSGEQPGSLWLMVLWVHRVMEALLVLSGCEPFALPGRVCDPSVWWCSQPRAKKRWWSWSSLHGNWCIAVKLREKIVNTTLKILIFATTFVFYLGGYCVGLECGLQGDNMFKHAKPGAWEWRLMTLWGGAR